MINYGRVCSYMRMAFGVVMMSVLSLMLGGCKLAILDAKGTVAAHETRLLIIATYTMLLVVIPAMILTIYFAWKYHARRRGVAYTPQWSHSTWLEITWWGIPCAIIIVLAVITWISTHKLDPYRPLASKVKPLIIQVISLNWKWLFIYPQEKIATVNFVEFPVKRPIEFQITSDAPMNSFQIVQLAGQIYAMAGMRTKLNLNANEAGDYHGLSTSFSGQGFSDMKFVARATSQQQFAAWIKQVQRAPKKLTLSHYKQLAKDSENNPVAYYSNVSADLFNQVIMKYMKPSGSGHRQSMGNKENA